MASKNENETAEDKKAAREGAEQESLMREVDEAVRHDQVGSFTKTYGWPLGIGLVLGLGVFGGWLFWDDRAEGQLEVQSEQFVTALDELEAGNLAIADRELAPIASESGVGMEASAKMVQAGIALQEGRNAEAIALYNAVAEAADTPGPFKDIATIRAVAAEYDEMDPQDVIDRLGPLATADNPWFGTAGEMVALAYLEQDKPDQAGPLLVEIATNDNVPASLRARARQLSGFLGFDAVEDVEDTLAEMVVAEDGDAEDASISETDASETDEPETDETEQ